MKATLLAFLLLSSFSSFARECTNQDTLESVTHLDIRLKKTIKVEGNLNRFKNSDTVAAHFSKGEVTTHKEQAQGMTVTRRVISLRISKSELEGKVIRPFTCSSAINDNGSKAALSLESCPIEAIFVNRQLLDMRDEKSVTLGSLKHNLGQSFEVSGECCN